MKLRRKMHAILPQVLIAPSMLAVGICVYAFIAYTFYISLTGSRILPSLTFVGFGNYFKIWSLANWFGAVSNLVFFAALFIGLGTVFGLFLAILFDQKLRGLNRLKPIFLYPMALSFVVVGTGWKWLLDPSIGLEDAFQQWGWHSFSFNWIKDRHYALYCIVIAALWQATGFVMLLFLAGMRHVDPQIIKAAQIDGAPSEVIYRRIVVPLLRPVFFVVVAFLGYVSVRTYDLVIALTGGGPGRSTEFPANFMYSYTYGRNDMAMGATSAILMTLVILVFALPLLILKMRRRRS